MIEIKKGTTFYVNTVTGLDECTIVDIILDNKNANEVVIFTNTYNDYLAKEKSLFIKSNDLGLYKAKS